MQYVLTLFSALLLPLSLPNEVFPYGLSVIGFFSLVPILLVLYHSTSWRESARLGALFGAISTAIGNYWLAFFGDFAVWTIGGAVLGYTVYNYILFGYLHFLAHPPDVFRTRRQTGSWYRRVAGLVYRGTPWSRPLMIALSWTAYEYLKSTGFLGYPWGLIAYPPAAFLPIAQAAEIGGVWILSFFGAWINTAIVELLVYRENSARRPLRAVPGVLHNVVAVALVGAVLVGFGSYRLHQLRPTPSGVAGETTRETAPSDTPRHGEDSLTVVLVQQNIDSWAPGRFADALRQAQDVTLRTIADHRATVGSPIDFVVWSETSLRRPYYGPHDEFYQNTPSDLPFLDFLRIIDVPLITGIPMPAAGDARDLSNSAVILDPDGTIIGQYAKQQLVPFAELIPFWEIPAVRSFFRDVVGVYGTWMPGRESNVVSVPLGSGTENGSVAVGLPICFEDGFGWVPREMVSNGAALLVNLTNNSWSRQDSAQTQHYVAAQLRSIELRTTLLRGTNSGLSGVVDRRGVLLESLPMFESTARVVRVPVPEPQWTLYRAIGDAFGILAVLLVLVQVATVHATTRSRPFGLPATRKPVLFSP